MPQGKARDSARRPFVAPDACGQPRAAKQGLAAAIGADYDCPMADTAISGALDRLHAAIDRLDGAVEAVVNAPKSATPVIRDDKLRDEVRAVIGELDRMIGGQRG